MNIKEIKDSVIFAVDDNKENLKVLVQYLSDFELKVIPLRSGEELLNLIPKRIPDMILLDIMMPGGIDGYETCRRLKADRTAKDIPVLFMSALTDTFDKVTGFSLGAVDYITKPIETEELLSRIHTHLSISRLQKELFKMNTQLEEKVLIRTEELIKAKEKAEESDRLKSAFLATISHELRTPLNAIIGFSDLISSGMLEDKIIKYTQIINKSGQHLLSLIEEIMHISLIESKDIIIKKEKFYIGQVMEDISSFITQETKAKNKEELKFIKKIPKELESLQLETDRNKLKHVLYALLKNAIKFTEKGTVEYGYKVYNKENLVFFVKDTGIGIPDNKQEIIFKNFRQADDSDTRLYGGLGIGLSIAKRLVDPLGGNIWVESEVAKGSTFYFTLPCDKCPGQKEIQETEDENYENIRFPGKTILIAEDEADNYLYLEEILERTGIKIIWAKNGLEAVETCKTVKDIDLILMDIKMPVMEGLAASKLIKEFRPDLYIIAQTAYAMPGDEEKAIKIGIDDYIDKPIRGKELMMLISEYL